MVAQLKNFNQLPKYKELNGILAGSQQPGYGNKNPKKDLIILANLKRLRVKQLKDRGQLRDCGVDEELLSALDFIYSKKIATIYSLCDYKKDRNPELIKLLWENLFQDTEYILEINGISTEIEDYAPPSQEQLNVISQDVIKNMYLGKNILVHCGYGVGRTGTVLSGIHMSINANLKFKEAIDYIRSVHVEDSVEKSGQVKSLKIYGKKFHSTEYVYNRTKYHLNYIQKCNQSSLSEDYFKYVKKFCEIQQLNVEDNFKVEEKFSNWQKLVVALTTCLFIIPGILFYKKFKNDNKKACEAYEKLNYKLQQDLNKLLGLTKQYALQRREV